MRERTFLLSRDGTRFIRTKFGEQSRIAREMQLDQGRLGHYLAARRHIPESLLIKLCRTIDKKPSDLIENPAEKLLADSAFTT